MTDDTKPKRLYFETYLQLIRNSVGTEMFGNFYVEDAEKGKFDAVDGGSNSCAFFVSGVLVMFDKIKALHGLVTSTIKDMEESGWYKVEEIRPGDVIHWEPMEYADGWHEHIGFALGNNRAVSTSMADKKVIEHDIHFGDTDRQIKQIYRLTGWD